MSRRLSDFDKAQIRDVKEREREEVRAYKDYQRQVNRDRIRTQRESDRMMNAR